VAGAALLLEPDPGSLVGSAAWARPTLFAGTAEELGRFALAARRQRRSRFRRLRAALVAEAGPLSAEEEAFWRERGVLIRFLPQCGIAWYISGRGDRHA
jgi:hypothetical protein